MIKMHDAGEKQSEQAMAKPSRGEKQVWYSSLNLNTDQVPELSNFGHGRKVQMQIEAIIRRVEISGSGDKKVSFYMDIQKVGIMNSGPGKTQLEKDLRGK